ncbi:MAG: hypothetical protein K0S37_4821 [Microbacterium sp.]|nr:hypothetical protein [Microbacterium sp.]
MPTSGEEKKLEIQVTSRASPTTKMIKPSTPNRMPIGKPIRSRNVCGSGPSGAVCWRDDAPSVEVMLVS